MEKASSPNTLLSIAASQLKKEGDRLSVKEQIDLVGNALTGTRRTRMLDPLPEGVPPEAENVLEMLRIQVDKSLETLVTSEEIGSLYERFMSDLEQIEIFVQHVLEFYEVKQPQLLESVYGPFQRAKKEAITNLAIEKMYQKVDLTEQAYRSNPEMSQEEYQECLTNLSQKVKSWEQELQLEKEQEQHSKTITARVNKLRDKLNQATELVRLEEHPLTIGQKGLEILRKASEMIQQAKSQSEVEQVVLMAEDAKKNLDQGGESFRERGRSFNLQIGQTVVAFVNKQIKKFETELSEAEPFSLRDFEKSEAMADQLVRQMEQLIVCFGLVKKWGGPRQGDLLERIAMVYETIVQLAEKRRIQALQEAALNHLPEEHASILAKISAKYQKVEMLGSDIIKPAEIFREKGE